MGLFNFFKKTSTKVIIPELGVFDLISDNQETRIEGKYISHLFGEIEISMPTVSGMASEYQITTLRRIESDWKRLIENYDNEFEVLSILIPEEKSFAYNEINAEVVVRLNKHIKSIIIKDFLVEVIIDVE